MTTSHKVGAVFGAGVDVVDLEENRVLTASCHRRPLSPRRLQRVTQLRTAHAVAASAWALDRRRHRPVHRRRHRLLLGSLTHHIRHPRSAARRLRLCHRLPRRHHHRPPRATCAAISTPFVALATATLAAAAAPTAAVAVVGTTVGAAAVGTYAWSPSVPTPGRR